MQLEAKSIDSTEAIQNLTTIVQGLAQDMATADGYRPSPLLHSCEEIKNKWPDNSSDYYTLMAAVVMSTVRWNRFVAVVAG